MGHSPRHRKISMHSPEMQKLITQVKPGLSGVGSIIFRSRGGDISRSCGLDRFYEKVITPHKGEIEAWYINNQTLSTYFSVIFSTIWVVIFPHPHWFGRFSKIFQHHQMLLKKF